jgi:hypothetical protein
MYFHSNDSRRISLKITGNNRPVWSWTLSAENSRRQSHPKSSLLCMPGKFPRGLSLLEILGKSLQVDGSIPKERRPSKMKAPVDSIEIISSNAGEGAVLL